MWMPYTSAPSCCGCHFDLILNTPRSRVNIFMMAMHAINDVIVNRRLSNSSEIFQLFGSLILSAGSFVTFLLRDYRSLSHSRPIFLSLTSSSFLTARHPIYSIHYTCKWHISYMDVENLWWILKLQLEGNHTMLIIQEIYYESLKLNSEHAQNGCFSYSCSTFYWVWHCCKSCFPLVEQFAHANDVMQMQHTEISL